MLNHDNLQWRIFLRLCLLCTNDVIASVIKPDILEALDDIPGYDLTDGDMLKYHIWPQGNIPYYIDDFSFDKVLRDRIRSNLDQISKLTGLHFMEIPQPPKDDESRWVFFLNRKAQLECEDVSYQNFTSNGVQRVVLGYDCVKSEDLAEIILSLVGVAPQHNSPDRDDYITVHLENILPEKHYLFKKMRPEEWLFNKFEYDFASVGHYNTHKYTINGAETISPKNRENYIGGSKGLSAMDIKKIRTTYNYISYKGKNQIKVPECSKLFVTGSNFSNYVPATKSDERLKKPLPNYSEDPLPENTKNNMSKEVDLNEPFNLIDDININKGLEKKQKNAKDKVGDEDTGDETDNKEQMENQDAENLSEINKNTKNGSGSNIDNASQQQQNPDTEKLENNSNTSVSKIVLLKSKQREKKRQIMSKSDYSSGDEAQNNYLNENIHLL